MPRRQPDGPGGHPVTTQRFIGRLPKPLIHRSNQGRCILQQAQRLQVKLEILRPGRSHADGVHPRILETEQVVEDDGMQRCTQLQQPLGWRVQMAALVSGTDDEHPHVLTAGRIQRGAVVLADVIPVQIHVIEGTGVAGLCDQGCGAMGGEAHVTNAALRLPAAHHLHAAPGLKGLLKMLRQVDAVDGQ